MDEPSKMCKNINNKLFSRNLLSTSKLFIYQNGYKHVL